MIVLALACKELELYFTSVLFYVLAAVFLVITGYYFYTNLNFFVMMGGMNLTGGFWQYQLFDMRQQLLSLVPLLTMRLFAEERKLGTLELLWTYPVRDWEIVAGKFVACVGVVTVMLAATLLHPLLIVPIHQVDAGPLVAGYLGLWLLASAFVACGLFLSALTDSQLVAGASAYGVLLFFWTLTWNEAAVSEGWLRLLQPFSLFDRFQMFAVGAIDSSAVTYLVFFAVAFLAFTFFALDSRRWRGIRGGA